MNPIIKTEFTADNRPLLAAAREAKNAILEYSHAADIAKEAFRKLLAGAGIFGFVETVKKTYESVDNLVASANKLNVSVGGFQALQNAAVEANVDIETLESGLLRLRKSIGAAGSGDANTKQAFAALGLSASKLAAEDLTAAYADIATQLNKVGDSTDQAQIAIAIFGKAGQEQLNLLRSDLRKTIEEAKKNGDLITPEQAEQFKKFDEDVKRLANTISNKLKQAFIDLIPNIKAVGAAISSAVDTSKATIKDVGDSSWFGSVKSGFSAVSSGISDAASTGRELALGVNPTPAPYYFAPKTPNTDSTVPAITNALKGMEGALVEVILNVNELSKKADVAAKSLNRVSQTKLEELLGLKIGNAQEYISAAIKPQTQIRDKVFDRLLNEIQSDTASGVGIGRASVSSKIATLNGIAQQTLPGEGESKSGMLAAAQALTELAQKVQNNDMVITVKTEQGIDAYVQGPKGQRVIYANIHKATAQEAAATGEW